MTAHWGVQDPAAVVGAESWRRQSFLDVAHVLKRRIELMLALPLDKLAPMAIQSQLDQIGKS